MNLGAQCFDPRINVLKLAGESGICAATSDISQRAPGNSLVQPLHLVGETVKARKIVLDPVETLQIGVDDFEGFFELAEAIAASAATARSAPRPDEGRGHDQKQRRRADQNRQERQTGLKGQPSCKCGRGDGHSDQNDHIKHGEPS